MKHRRRGARPVRIAALAACAAILPACLGPRNFENENDRLRRQLAELTDTLEQLERERDEWRAKAQAARADDPADELPAEAIPALARITISPRSYIERNPDKSLLARIGVAASDGRGHPIQAVGSLTVRLLDPAADSLSVLAERSLTPLELRQAYTRGFTGMSYKVELPFEHPATDNPNEQQTLLVSISAVLTDPRTGQVYSASRDLSARILDTPSNNPTGMP